MTKAWPLGIFHHPVLSDWLGKGAMEDGDWPMGGVPWVLAETADEKFAFPGAAELGCRPVMIVAILQLGGGDLLEQETSTGERRVKR